MHSSTDLRSLQQPVEQLLHLAQSLSHSSIPTGAIHASLQKAIAPTFEIVFAGAFSAGKSMLINALLERELLYSAEGHATGTECQIAYAEPDQERVVLTFLSEAEIRSQVEAICDRLGITATINLNSQPITDALVQKCQELIDRDGGDSKSEQAKQARALQLLVQGLIENRSHIHTTLNNTRSMEQCHFANLHEAASYARRGSNSAVLKRVEYYCHHDLLRDGNVLIDTPGIDAPVQRDAELTYRKIAHSDTSAVVCVLKAASAGDLTTEETALLETTRQNAGIRDRVFYVFNRIDETWYNSQLKQRLETLIHDQFRTSDRVYQTSGLLGFYGSQLRQTNSSDRFGLDSIFADSYTANGTPQFVNELIRYCANSGKLPPNQFRIDVRSYESPSENYVRILNEQSTALIEQLIIDSGIEAFRTAITRYLTQEKRPQLLIALVEDLQPLCRSLRTYYLEQWQKLATQPQDAETFKSKELQQLSLQLQDVSADVRSHLEQEINAVVASDTNTTFEVDFRRLKARLVSRLDELLNTFSVGAVHQRAQSSHRRNSVVPLLGILAEAFYYLANGLEEVLVDASAEVVNHFFDQLQQRIRQQDYYRKLERLLGSDHGFDRHLDEIQNQVVAAIVNEARTECDRYVRERPEFFTEGTASLFQLRQTLQQACRGYDYQNMVEAEAAIRQLLKLDFEQKVKDTVLRSFRQTLNQTLNAHLMAWTDQQVNWILQQYDQARVQLTKVLEAEAEVKLRQMNQQRGEIADQIRVYNEAIAVINQCLIDQQLIQHQLPTLEEFENAGLVVRSEPAISNPVTLEQWQPEPSETTASNNHHSLSQI